ncbi:MAG: sigma-54-dependent Fis family transcriptional regulator [Deltaproteobacteria bacterium]|nr:sigma-54-dependent Fis family transcriptional regulator [Deltaproteobacteria bacterium]
MGYRVLLAEKDENMVSRIQRLSPRLWVEQIDGEPEAVFSTLRTVREACPDLQIVLVSHEPTIEDAVKAVRMGVLDYVPDGVSTERLWGTLVGALQHNAVKMPPAAIRGAETTKCAGYPVAADPSMRRVLELAEKVAPSRATILIQGESGTGKEVIARHVHNNSERRQGPFVAVNCAALPENLLESELFGHERGAFTGAVARKKGKFELAHGGTLLLDEISEMALSVQAKLLRVLQEREIDRVGGEIPIPIDTRVIATTNRDLDGETKKGSFRLDLFYRLSVVPIHLPPLRNRPDDILPLASFFLKKHSQLNATAVKKLSRDGEEFLKKRAWPGNVRELENLMERTLLLAEGERITRSDLESLSVPETAEGGAPDKWALMPLRELEKRMIKQALHEHHGNRTHAAEILGISVRTLRNKLHEYRQEMEGEESGVQE